MTSSHVHVVDHPLVQHKLSLMRERDRSTKGFRELLNEIGMLLAYEVTRDLPLELVDIETPIAPMKEPKIAGKKLTLAPILRAGVGFLDGMLALMPSARIAHIGLYRDPTTLQAVEYYFKAPQDLTDRTVILMDPMLATGNSACAAAELLKARGARDIRFVCLLAAPEGIAQFGKEHPDIPIWTAAIDEKLCQKGVHFVPCCALGEEISVDELVHGLRGLVGTQLAVRGLDHAAQLLIGNLFGFRHDQMLELIG